ncbi:MAG TPA: alpha/beta fold hydrolase [Nannocystis exedens]|nr:alpha/beta fold hydrolase [Nannocystis exedens]
MLRRLALLALTAALGLFACTSSPKNKALAALRHPAASTRSDTLLVFLPGAGDPPSAFAKHSFVAAVRESRAPVDILAVDAHIGYYLDRTLVDRLWQDIISPAKSAGYNEIWVVGISMGGLGALLFAQEHSESIDGIVLLAPYLGKKRTLRAIATAGVRNWQPDPKPGSFDYELWRWLKGYQQSNASRPALYLGYGTDDPSASAHALLAELLPKTHIFTAPGDHDWTVWTPLWRRILASPELPLFAASSTDHADLQRSTVVQPRPRTDHSGGHARGPQNLAIGRPVFAIVAKWLTPQITGEQPTHGHQLPR